MQKLLAVLLMLTSLSVSASLSVTTSQNQIVIGEQLTVEIETNRATDSTPNLSQLSQEFSVLSLERMLLGQANRDHTEYRTRWYLKLKPRKAGQLTIPSLNIDGELSEPLIIQVKADSQQPVIIARQLLTSPPVYKDQALLIDLEFSQQNPFPDAAQIRIEQASSYQFRTLTPLTVTQQNEHWIANQRIAVYFNETGTLATPQVELLTPQGAVLSDISPEIIEVLPPAYQTRNGGWLPAEQLKLEDSWNQLHRTAAGDQLTREITLIATGPLPIQLPEFPLPEQFRRIKSELNENQDAFGVTSSRTEIWEIDTANQASLQTESVEFPWWDTKAQQTRVLTIPARSLTFDYVAASDEPVSQPLLSNTQILLLTGFAGLSTFIAAITLALYIQRTRLLSRRNRMLDQDLKQTQYELNEHHLFLSLMQACERNHAKESEQLLLSWIPYVWPETAPESLDSLCLDSGEAQLNLLLFQLIEHLSHPQETDWDGSALSSFLKTLRRRYITGPSYQNDVSDQGEMP